MTDRPTCANCRFCQRPEPARLLTIFGWCMVPLPPHVVKWGTPSGAREVRQDYYCVLHQPDDALANAEPAE